MSYKLAVVTPAWMLLAGVFALTSCADDECTKAATRLADCNIGSSPSSETSVLVSCDGEMLCAALCINGEECAALEDGFSGMPSSASESFLACATECRTKK